MPSVEQAEFFLRRTSKKTDPFPLELLPEEMNACYSYSAGHDHRCVIFEDLEPFSQGSQDNKLLPLLEVAQIVCSGARHPIKDAEPPASVSINAERPAEKIVCRREFYHDELARFDRPKRPRQTDSHEVITRSYGSVTFYTSLKIVH
jgi:hypothetical protein